MTKTHILNSKYVDKEARRTCEVIAHVSGINQFSIDDKTWLSEALAVENTQAYLQKMNSLCDSFPT